MATWTRFYINTADIEEAKRVLKDISNISLDTQSDIPEDFHDSFMFNETQNPNYLILGKVQEEWVTVLYNSANKLEEWSKIISKELDCKLILTIAQNTVDYYYYSQYRNGEKEREIQVCYGDDMEVINFGAPYDFEHEEPGEKQNFDGEISYFFDFDSLNKYARYFGLNIQEDWDDVNWSILKGEQNHVTMGDFANKQMNRMRNPWWKFWQK